MSNTSPSSVRFDRVLLFQEVFDLAFTEVKHINIAINVFLFMGDKIQKDKLFTDKSLFHELGYIEKGIPFDIKEFCESTGITQSKLQARAYVKDENGIEVPWEYEMRVGEKTIKLTSLLDYVIFTMVNVKLPIHKLRKKGITEEFISLKQPSLLDSAEIKLGGNVNSTKRIYVIEPSMHNLNSLLNDYLNVNLKMMSHASKGKNPPLILALQLSLTKTKLAQNNQKSIVIQFPLLKKWCYVSCDTYDTYSANVYEEKRQIIRKLKHLAPHIGFEFEEVENNAFKITFNNIFLIHSSLKEKEGIIRSNIKSRIVSFLNDNKSETYADLSQANKHILLKYIVQSYVNNSFDTNLHQVYIKVINKYLPSIPTHEVNTAIEEFKAAQKAAMQQEVIETKKFKAENKAKRK